MDSSKFLLLALFWCDRRTLEISARTVGGWTNNKSPAQMLWDAIRPRPWAIKEGSLEIWIDDDTYVRASSPSSEDDDVKPIKRGPRFSGMDEISVSSLPPSVIFLLVSMRDFSLFAMSGEPRNLLQIYFSSFVIQIFN